MNNSDIFIDFVQNIAIALSLIFIFSLIRPYLKQAPDSIYKISMGILFGLIAFSGMLIPIEILPGVIMALAGHTTTGPPKQNKPSPITRLHFGSVRVILGVGGR